MSLKFNPFTGTLDFTGSVAIDGAVNFSYEELISTDEVTVPVRQQMLVHNLFNVDDGLLDLQGCLVLLN